jgi:hypothetical protein
MKSTDPRHTVEWQRLRKRIVTAARIANLLCAHCGQPIRYDLGGRHPFGPSVDHTYALALNPELAFEPHCCGFCTPLATPGSAGSSAAPGSESPHLGARSTRTGGDRVF